MRLNRIAAVFYCLIKCRIAVSVAIPVSKVRGIYSVLHSDGLPRSLCSLAMTTKKKYVILSASEISHRKSDNVYFRKIIF